MYTLFSQTLDFGSRSLHVPPRHQHQRNETARCSIAPVMQVPVVVGLNRSQGHSTVGMRLKALTSKAGESRKAKRTQYTVGVHVIDTVADAPSATAHLLVPQRLHAVFLFGPANYRVQAHRSEEHTSELQSRENLACRLLLDKR